MWGLVICAVLFFDGVKMYPQYILIPEAQEEEDASLNVQSNKQLSTTSDTFILGSCIVVLSRLCPDRDVTFHLFTRRNPTTPEGVRIGGDHLQSNLSQTAFDPSLPTKVIVHGYNSDMNLRVLVEIRNEYLKSAPMNVFTVDWGPLAQGPCYPAAVWNAKFAGRCSAQLLERILEYGTQDVHVIGFSLGAHVTNYIANNLRPYKLPRITGLDPAMPGFITVDNEDKLDAGDAQFVDVIHTNAFLQGKVEESGHVDFFVNGGVIQPGCWAENRFFACNHHRAPLYFAESINSPRGFWGWPCPSYWVYLTGQCPPREPQIIMGEHVSRNATGVYLVITDSVPPYAVGKYTGPLIEILLKQMERSRISDLERLRGDVECVADEEEVFERVECARTKVGNRWPRWRIPQFVNNALDFSLSYSDVLNK